LTTVQVGVKKVGPWEAPILEWRALNAGEKPKSESVLYRQVLSSHKKRRIEWLNQDSQEPWEVVVFDGEVRKAFQRATSTGLIAAPTVRHLDDGHDYATFFRNGFGAISFVTLFGQRASTRVVADRSGKASVIESPPGGADVATFGWRLWLDPRHGLLPKRIERYENSMEHVYCRTVINQFHEFEPGVWAPVDVTVTFHHPAPGTPHYGDVNQVVHSVVDVSRSRWNEPLSDELFVLAFPAGVTVADKTHRVVLVTGERDTGKNIDKLVAGARKTFPLDDGRPAPLPIAWWWRVALVALNAVLIAAFLAWLWRRHRRLATP
jgi:hypothetical protein